MNVNSCGKETFLVSDVNRLKRFLSFGCEGTYYIHKSDNVAQCSAALQRLLDAYDTRVLEIIEDYAVNNKCKKYDAIIYALTMCCLVKNQDYRKAAYVVMPKVCKTVTQLFQFIETYKKLSIQKYQSSGWNGMHKRSIAQWYTDKPVQDLIYLSTKYKNRHTYSHKDVLRLAHPKPTSDAMKLVFGYLTDKKIKTEPTEDKDVQYVCDFIKDYSTREKLDTDGLVQMIHKWKWTREHVPNTMFDSQVWSALLDYMPSIGLLRNLNNITKIGDTNVNKILERIDLVKNLHPAYVLIASRMVNNTLIRDRLDTKLMELLHTCNGSDKRICLAVDISGSMTGNTVLGTDCIKAADVACLMALAIKARCPNAEITGFAGSFMPLTKLNPQKSFTVNLSIVRQYDRRYGFMSTDISVPFRWAWEQKKKFDAFVVITDNETNSNHQRPDIALRDYKQFMGVPECKLVVLATSSNGFTIADPNNMHMLDIAGFDASVPDTIIDFINE